LGRGRKAEEGNERVRREGKEVKGKGDAERRKAKGKGGKGKGQREGKGTAM